MPVARLTATCGRTGKPFLAFGGIAQFRKCGALQPFEIALARGCLCLQMFGDFEGRRGAPMTKPAVSEYLV
jgi:hypothetical protein